MGFLEESKLINQCVSGLLCCFGVALSFQGHCVMSVSIVDHSGRDFHSVYRSDLIKTCEQLASGR